MTTRPLGLICAIPDEIAHFGASFTKTSTRNLAGLTFREGTLEGRPIGIPYDVVGGDYSEPALRAIANAIRRSKTGSSADRANPRT